ncbi:NADH dehydrogenase subunit K [Synechococcus sp. PCC 7336]|uniref:NADH dehydrogenase subunit K n=1 Tax=Synechococcus sp. PCC 7336 TaxID=195250 RepID=UPI00036E26F2|nr:NADH dehydrogenase subunit K [Synechococcus sp. PCC 7336]
MTPPESETPSANPAKELQFPLDKPQVTSDLSNNVILTSLNDLYSWAKMSSVWPLLYGTSCCFIEFAALIGSRFDFDRFGLLPRSTPRQADLIVTAGTVTMKMAPALVKLYQQMPEPKYVIAMGACTITGGMFSSDSYTTVRGVDKLIPVDVYIPGCPPRPEAIIDAIIKLRKKIAAEDIRDRGKLAPTHRYYSIPHELEPVPEILTGQYLEAESRQAPPAELAAMYGMPVPEAMQAEPEQLVAEEAGK